VNLRAVDRDDADANHARFGAQLEHAAEQLGQRVLVALDKPRDRRVIRRAIRRDHPKRHIVLAGALDRTRRPRPPRVAIEHQRDHHRRVIGRAAVTVVPVGAVERRQIKLGDGVDHKPRQMPLGQPVTDVGRQQKRLLAVTTDEVLRHA
jgi:hypothetical protein